MQKFIDIDSAPKLLHTLAGEFAVIKNPEYIHPPFELAPLAPKLTSTLPALTAAVMDMDGTTTTTEELCIHSLENMVRRMSSRSAEGTWSGLDHTLDYPNIIGNSTTKHVEYLITKYHGMFDRTEILRSYLFAAVWTLLVGVDQKRKEEATINLTNLRLGGLIQDPFYAELANAPASITDREAEIGERMLRTFGTVVPELSRTDLVKVGIDIYYQRYHAILQRIKRGESRQISTELFQDPERRLIQPMPGILFFLALLKGWLGDEAGALVPHLLEEYEQKAGHVYTGSGLNDLRSRIERLSVIFGTAPAKLSIVTSSIFYEADIVMGEVFSVLSSQLEQLPLSGERKRMLAEKFRHYRNVYDAFITASDSTEIRLKPHRDLYSLALHRLDVPVGQFGSVIGFEDSESGTIAIRAAGIGRCIAVPFAQTKGHDFTAATLVCSGGIPEVVIEHNACIRS